MNRLQHLEKTFIANIIDNEEFPNIEFVLLNYNSNDNLDIWVKDNLLKYIESGLVKYYHTKEPMYFDQSHAKNMVFRLATGDIICNIDADNYTGKGFALYVNEILKEDAHNRMLIRNQELKVESDRNTLGRICVYKSSFYKINGFDEAMRGYGFEDTDFINRLKKTGIRQSLIIEDEYLKSIPHSQALRVQESEFTNTVEKILLRYINHFTSEVIILYKNNMLESTQLVDNKLYKSLYQNRGLVQEARSNNYDMLFKENKLFYGNWIGEKENLTVKFTNPNYTVNLTSYQNADNLIYTSDKNEYRCLSSGYLFDSLIYTYPQIKNRIALEINHASDRTVNPNGFGRGKVHLNFSKEFEILD